MRGVLKKVAKRIFWAVCIFVCVAVGLLAAFWLSLFSKTASPFIARQGIALYDNAVPGRIDVARVENSLAEGLVLGDLALCDAHGDLLVSVDAAQVRVSPWPLLAGRVVIEKIGVEGANIRIPKRGDTLSYADLAPRGEDETAKPSAVELLRVELPISVTLDSLTLKDIYLESRTSKGQLKRLASVKNLELNLRAHADSVHIFVKRLEGRLSPLRVRRGVISANLHDGYMVSMPMFNLDSNYGSLSFMFSDMSLGDMAMSISAAFNTEMRHLVSQGKADVMAPNRTSSPMRAAASASIRGCCDEGGGQSER